MTLVRCFVRGFSVEREWRRKSLHPPALQQLRGAATNGGNTLQEALRDGRDVEAVLEKLDVLYRQSRQTGSPSFQIN